MSDGAVSTKAIDVDTILVERGKVYGTFKLQAQITRALMDIFSEHMRIYNLKKLTPTQTEAAHMIFSKLGRIANGEPNCIDSWVDIAGYAKLVVKELEENEEFNNKR